MKCLSAFTVAATVAFAMIGVAGAMAVGGVAELLFGVRAEQQSLENIARPLTAEEAEERLAGWRLVQAAVRRLNLTEGHRVRALVYGIGYAIDSAMTPYVYFVPWYATIAAQATDIVNERSLNLDRFERVAETTIDLYSAVRNAYLQRRAAAIKQ